MRHADVAMYVAKRSNSGYSFYSVDQDTHSPTRLALMAELREAIDANQLVAHYQPIISVRTGQVVGVETLVRWAHPERGLILPDEFIPAAEQTGLIRPLAAWVLERAVEQTSAWTAAGLELVVSINLSTRNLHDPHLTEKLAALLSERRVDPRTLQLEITESALMADPEHALTVLRGLADMGLKLAIDDYGTGYSSLAYLRRLPAHELKIDKSFVAEMSKDGNDAVIVQVDDRTRPQSRAEGRGRGRRGPRHLATSPRVRLRPGPGQLPERPPACRRVGPSDPGSRSEKARRVGLNRGRRTRRRRRRQRSIMTECWAG